MIITHLNSGRKAKFTLEGTTLNIGILSIDLQERQGDVQRVIDVCLDTTYTAQEGVGAWYVATIIIPSREYQLVENDNSETSIVPMSLDVSKVEIRLWALPEGVEL
jgi:hypothetical protein